MPVHQFGVFFQPVQLLSQQFLWPNKEQKKQKNIWIQFVNFYSDTTVKVKEQDKQNKQANNQSLLTAEIAAASAAAAAAASAFSCSAWRFCFSLAISSAFAFAASALAFAAFGVFGEK